MSILDKFNGLCYVRRWNFHPHVRSETVAEHSAAVGMLSYLIAIAYGLDKPTAREAAVAGLFHDLGEVATGDIPALVKNALPKGVFSDLEARAHKECSAVSDDRFVNRAVQRALDPTGTNALIVKAADLVDAWRYVRLERSLGSVMFQRIEAELLWALRSVCSRQMGLGTAVEIVVGERIVSDTKHYRALPNPEALCHL